MLGVAENGAFGVFTTILALLGGVTLLNEAVKPLKIIGVVLVAYGVLLASGYLSRPKLKKINLSG